MKDRFVLLLVGLAASVFSTLTASGENILPPSWGYPTEPSPDSQTCSSCTAKSGRGTSESPSLNDNGGMQMNIDLATISPVSQMLLKIQLGAKLQFAPSEVYQILTPNSNGGSKKVLTAKIGGAKISFDTTIQELGAKKVHSSKFPEYSISKDEENLLLANENNEFLFSPSDNGSSWLISEIRNRSCPERSIKCEYNKEGLIVSIVLPDGHKYTVEYKNGQVAKVKDPAGALTELAWNGSNHLTCIKTTLLPGHPFYVKNDKSNTKGELNIIRNIYVEYDKQDRIACLINSNGEKYSVEYRNTIDSAKQVLTSISVLTYPDGSAKYTRTVSDKNANMEKIDNGFLVRTQEGAETFVSDEEVLKKKLGSYFTAVSKITNGKEIQIGYDENTHAKISETDALGRVTNYKYDRNGRKTAVIYPDKSTVSYKYDECNRKVQTVNEDGIVTQIMYEKELLKKIDDGGIVTTYEYDSKNRPSKTIMPDGVIHAFEWDNLFRLKSYTKPDGVKVQYTYAGLSGNITEIKTLSADGKKSYSKKYTYDTKGRILKISYPDATSESFAYDCCNLVKTVDKAGAVTKYAYDSSHRKTLEVSPNGDKTFFEYDFRGNLVKTVYPNKTQTIVKYDEFGRSCEVVHADGSWEKYAYDAAGNKIGLEKSNGTKSEYAYSLRNRMIAIKGDALRNIVYDISPAGNFISMTNHGLPFDKNGRRTVFEYDSAKRIAKITNSDGTRQINTYAGMSRKILSSERNGVISAFRYNAAGQLTATAEYTSRELAQAAKQAGQEALFKSKIKESRAYDSFGNLFEVRNAVGRLIARYNYAPDGKLESVLRPLSETGAEKQSYVYKYGSDGIVTVSVHSRMVENPKLAKYDYRDDCGVYRVATLGDSAKAPELGRLLAEYAEKAGRRLWAVDQLGNKTEYRYNDRGQLEQLVSDGDISAAYKYDTYGRVAKTEDVFGRITEKVYGEDARLSKLIQPDGSESGFDYDKFGHMVKREGAGSYPLSYNYTSFGKIASYTDGNGAETKFEYNARGKLAKRIWADGSVTAYKYNDRGLLTAKEESGRVTGCIYDDANRLVRIETVFGNESAATEMKYDKDGRLAGVSDGSTSVEYKYDSFGRVAEESGPVGVIKYSYNERGLLSGRECSFRGEKGGFATKYNYDELNRVERVVSPAGEFVYTYDGKGRIESLKMGDSLVTYSYDKAGRLLSKKMGDAMLCAYEYDKLDRRVKAEVNGIKWEYGYDQYSQLTSAKADDGKSYNYSYDKIGNRMKFNEYAMAYNKLNQIAVNGYKYDAWGNLVQTPDTSYKYDLNNRLVEVKKNTVTVAYKYDALGQRIEAKESVAGVDKTTKYLMSGMVEYARLTENKAQYHTLGLDLAQRLNRTGAVGAVLASTKDNDSFNYLYDGNGNVISTTDKSGEIKKKISYSPFGELLGDKTTLLFSFSTKAADISGLSYYGFRFYNAELGKWLTKDPIKECGGTNIYLICSNNMISLRDYLGLSCDDEIAPGTYVPNLERMPNYTDEIEGEQRAKDLSELIDVLLAETGDVDGMEAIAAVIVNRLQTSDEVNFGGGLGYDTYSDVIGAPGQFDGFDTEASDARDRAGLIRDRYENGDSGAAELFNNAKAIATKIMNDPNSIRRTLTGSDGKEYYVYGLRTGGASSPGGMYQKLDIAPIGGNDFYYMTK